MRLMTESVKRMSEYREVLFLLLQKRTRAESLRQLRADLWFAKIHPLGCDAFIAMVKASEFRDFDDRATLHNLTLNRALLFERKMRPRSVVSSESRPPMSSLDGER
jgi:hypothetical protein